MDPHLELSLESDMGVHFETEDTVVVSQEGLILSDSNHEGIPMEFQQIEEQPIMMDTGSEEIIDFMGDQFSLQEYSVQDNQTTGLTTTAESNQNVLTSQAETMIDLQLNPQTSFLAETPKIISVKAAIPARHQVAPKKPESMPAAASIPRHVAIAPKPPKLVAKSFTAGKQFAITPKPLTVVKKVSLGNVVQTNTKGNTVLAQIGKQLVMMPAGTQKLKLVTANTGTPTMQYVRATSDQGPLIQTKDQKPVVVAKDGKVIMPGQSAGSYAVLTKIFNTNATKSSQPQFVAMQPKTVPITIANKQVVMTSPTKQGSKMHKKQQIIAIKSPTAKLLPAPSTANAAKKIVVSANPTQNVILKTTAPSKAAQVAKDSSILIEGQQTQLHQINVPGKGIQYIRLVTNSNATAAKPKGSGSLLPVTSKFVLANSKEHGKQLIRIAPVMPKVTATQQPPRSSQSLLAPLSPASETNIHDFTELVDTKTKQLETSPPPSVEPQACTEIEEIDTKAALRTLIEDTVHEEDTQDSNSYAEIEVEYKKPISPKQTHNTEEVMDPVSSAEESSLIVIPSGYDMEENIVVDDEVSSNDESQRSLINMESEALDTYQSPKTPQPSSETDLVGTELGLRPRKACNCTKSQCLKLYCDCFANGEFCNRCNCNNCHNNLENEELRQKAIRGCLDRNPNAFRPKIGKAKAGGPDIIRRHNKGCNCKRSGCLKNYCECYEAKIACTAMCRCVGCRNVEESLEHFRRAELPPRHAAAAAAAASRLQLTANKQPCTFMTSEVIEAVCQCLLAAASEAGESAVAGVGVGGAEGEPGVAGGEAGGVVEREPMRDVIEEFARCLQDIIGAAHHSPSPHSLLNQGTT